MVQGHQMMVSLSTPNLYIDKGFVLMMVNEHHSQEGADFMMGKRKVPEVRSTVQYPVYVDCYSDFRLTHIADKSQKEIW